MIKSHTHWDNKMTDYTTASGTTYTIVENKVLGGGTGFYKVKIVDPDGTTTFSTLGYGGGLLHPDIAGDSIFTPSSDFNISLSTLGTYIVTPGATGTMTALANIPLTGSTIWVGGTLNYTAVASAASSTTFNVDGGTLKATGGSVGSTLASVTVNLSNGGSFSQKSSLISALSSLTVNFGSGGGTYVANAGGSFLDLSSVAIKGFDNAKDYIKFEDMSSDPHTYSIQNDDGLLGLSKSQVIKIYDKSKNVIANVTVDGHNFSTGSFTVGQNGPLTITDSGTTISVEALAVTCFLSGSLIQTPKGTTTVEDITVGDEIIAYVDGIATPRSVIWTGQAHCAVRPHLPDDEAGYPVRILKDAIADGVPFKDMLITAEHCLFFDGQFVPARMLVNGRSIFFDKSITSYDYYHIETEDHSVIMADGMLTESYLDTGNRRSFSQKGNVVSIGGSRNLTWDNAAVPLTVSRATVEPLFRKIESRADKAGCTLQTEARPLTNDSDLHLMTNTGAIIRPARQHNGRVMFMIPNGIESVRIVSNASRPCDVIGPFVDDRRQLGVLVGTITLYERNRTRTLTDHLHDTSLSDWNNVEDGTMRWTNGNAMLPLGQRAPGSLAMMAIEVKAAGPYVLDETIPKHQAMKA
ncbi:Hint domain-containing protein [Acetobacter senegalensis]